ncbi:VCBS domain-containing protein, partial [Mesorhizobium sp. B2-1-3A]|uniref:beta strand repeat-containing protein n=1 Tax=Mesorhizobium sp. B2-1-3A TaxID=2589971 RepID=UPI00112A1815
AQTHPAGNGNNTLPDSVAVAVDGIGGTHGDGTISIVIVDDVPAAHNANAGALTEDGATTTVGGNVTTDYNNTFGADGPAASGSVSWGTVTATLGVNAINLTDYGTLTQNANGTWSFVLDNSKPATQALESGDTINVSLGYTLTDHDSDADTKTITFEINGTNDTPTITGDTTGVVVEAGNADPGTAIAGTTSTDPGALTAGTPTVTGTLTSHDPDTGATATWSGNAAGTYGSFAVNPTTGVWTYTLDNSKPATNALAEGASATETFTVTVTDDKGATSTQDVTVTITGANDSPVISYAAGNAAGGVTEDGTLTTSGQLASADPDTGHTAAWSVSPNSPQGTGTAYGSFSVNSSGQWTYTLNNGSAAVQGLAQGQTVTETYTVRVTDDKGAWDDQQVTVVINGANDTPTITVDTGNPGGANDMVYEAGLPAGSKVGPTTIDVDGTFKVSDPDGLSDVASVTVKGTTILIANLGNNNVINGDHGTLTITSYNAATGVATYVYHLTSPTTDVPNVTETDVFGLTVTDKTGANAPAAITIEIVDDVPTANADFGNVTEGALLQVNTAGGVLSNDVPGADGYAAGGGVIGVRAAGLDTSTAVTTGVNTQINGQYGTLTLQADGSYTYKATANAISANATDTFVYTVKDSDGDTSTTTLTINVANVTLAPVNQTGTVYEAALDTTTTGSDLTHGSVTGSNPTSPLETVTGQLAVTGTGITYTPISTTTAHGVFELQANGAWTYTLTSPFNSGAVQGANTLTGAESFTYTAKDTNGNTVTGTVKIDVVDDVPKIASIESQIVANAAGAHAGDWSYTPGADGLSTIAISLANQASISQIDHSTSTYDAATGTAKYTAFFDAAGTQPYFTVTMKADGTYNFEVINPVPTIVVTDTTALNAGSFGGNNYGLYLEQIAVKNNIPTPLHTDILFTGNAGWTSGTNLGNQATINSNTHGLGIGSGQTLDNKESITLKFLQGDGDKNSSTHPTTAVGMDHVTINFLQGSNGDAMTGNYAVRVITYDQNGVAHDQGSMNIVNGVLDISSASLMYGVSIINTGNTGLLVGGTTTSVTTATEIPHDVGLHFNVDVVDGDGDKASHGFDIVVDANDGHQATLTGDAAYDPNILSGGPGDDLLISAPGYNILTGGGGADTFKLEHLDIKDLITDYNKGQGDQIDLTALFDKAPAVDITNYVHYDTSTKTLSVDTSGSGANFVDVALLQNSPAAGTINILYDDTQHQQHTATI